jgi:hypothetical protein
VPLDQPGRVESAAELEQRPAKLLDGAEGPDPEQIFLQRSRNRFEAALGPLCTDA